MSEITEFQFLLEEISVFSRNLTKENADRRVDLKNITKKCKKLDSFAKQLEELRNAFNQVSREINIVNAAETVLLK